MQEVKFTLRVLTPLFLSGVDQTTAELRAPSFRGLMRYWYRALVGGMIDATPQSLSSLREAETALFGATDTGSVVTLKVSPTTEKAKEFTDQISVRVGGSCQATGKGYLLWSMAKSGKQERGNFKPARWYFPPGTSFHITLATRGTNASRLEQATAAFWLLTQLGGLGSRSRRCAGSLAVEHVQDNPTSLSFVQAASAQDLKFALEQGIEQVRAIVGKLPELAHKTSAPRSFQSGQTAFDILAPGACRIWVLQEEQPWQSAEKAMERLGENLQSYRSRIAISRRTIFGLPLPPLIFNRRRSSPLLLRVAELQDKKYVGIAVLFKTSGSDISPGDYKIIEDWIKTFHRRQEVML